MKPEMKEVRKRYAVPKRGLEPDTVKMVRKQAKKEREQIRKFTAKRSL